MRLYVIENVVNRRLYVGITSRRLSARWAEHKKDAKRGIDRAIYRAMRKYGTNQFAIREIDTARTWEALCRKEAALIRTIKSHSYNETNGGEGCPGHTVSNRTREKIRQKHLGKKLTPEHRAKLSAAKLGKKLPPRTAEHSAKISAGLIRAHARRRSQ